MAYLPASRRGAHFPVHLSTELVDDSHLLFDRGGGPPRARRHSSSQRRRRPRCRSSGDDSRGSRASRRGAANGLAGRGDGHGDDVGGCRRCGHRSVECFGGPTVAIPAASVSQPGDMDPEWFRSDIAHPVYCRWLSAFASGGGRRSKRVRRSLRRVHPLSRYPLTDRGRRHQGADGACRGLRTQLPDHARSTGARSDHEQQCGGGRIYPAYDANDLPAQPRCGLACGLSRSTFIAHLAGRERGYPGVGHWRELAAASSARRSQHHDLFGHGPDADRHRIRRHPNVDRRRSRWAQGEVVQRGP